MSERFARVPGSGALSPTRRQTLLLGGAAAAAAVVGGTGLASGAGTARAAEPRAVARPLVGATGITESDFSAISSQLGATELHYTFQPSFKGTWSQWLGAACTAASPAHLPLASTKWSSPTQADFTTLINSVPKDGKIRRICPWQEPEDNMDGATFTNVVRLLRNAVGSRTDVLVSLDLMTYSLNAASGRDVTTWMTTDADVIGWSVWPKGDSYASEETYVQKAAKLCDDYGRSFAISSFILDGSEDDAGAAGFVQWMTDFVADRHAAGKPTDHVVAYTPDTTAPWLTLAKTKAAAKTMFATLRGLS
ncbi:hypothetical protein [Streptomyces odontomachi]|uniref:hypothetical protein n=1 Tax=Streptomyces odontomachi TaxID=2944940 RepID=UPI00210A4EDA|nr:hypothetical protein [Streptomyces sp. ODS25]